MHGVTRDKSKFGERSRFCVFVGYPFGKKGWRVFDIERNEFLVSRDVIRVDVFPFAKKSEKSVTVNSPVLGYDEDWLISPTTEVRGSMISPLPVSDEPVSQISSGEIHVLPSPEPPITQELVASSLPLEQFIVPSLPIEQLGRGQR